MAAEDALFGPPRTVAMRPRWPVVGNAAYLALRLRDHDVYLRREALVCATELGRHHARTGPVEIGLLCLGRRSVDPQGTYTIVDELPLAGVGQRTTVEIPVATKLEVQRQHPALDVVGWAHTHPGFGVFFSGTDRENCEQYGPEAINLVYDPVAEQIGFALGAEILEVHPVVRALALAAPQHRSFGGYVLDWLVGALLVCAATLVLCHLIAIASLGGSNAMGAPTSSEGVEP